ncbi:hypothetical protein [uncultured Bradyrhizobium sp.]|uniref:hypothetical protein n=1 Tax=uncultured Bradyrhizobium sp. TaxID=199684 RepID=UPI0035CBEA5E
MSDSESENKQRDKAIARNEAQREAVSSLRVSSWAIGAALIAGLVVFAIVWVWLRR